MCINKKINLRKFKLYYLEYLYIMSAILDLLRLDDAYANKTVILNFCTAIGAFGLMPTPPKALQLLAENFKPFQWFLVAVLVYQGGGEQDIQLAIEVTVIVFIIYRIFAVIDGESFISFETSLSDASDASEVKEE